MISQFTLKFRAFLLVLLSVFFVVPVYSQNDQCNSASSLVIPSNGFELGTFNSTINSITTATVEPGEAFAPAIVIAGLTSKTIWYKFSLPTTRSIRVSLVQSGTTISTGDVGFAVYKTSECYPTLLNLSNKLTPISLFGSSFHPCVEAGDYLVQVSAKSVADGNVFIQLEVGSTVSAYDYATTAYDFGVISGVKTTQYEVVCQSIDVNEDFCIAFSEYEKYNKSTWQVFTTPSYFDYLSFFIAYQNTLTEKKIGYKIYRGDVRTTPLPSLQLISGCDTLTPFQSSARKVYKCGELQTGTTYSIQLFFHENFSDNVQVTLMSGGNASTQASTPLINLPASNDFGILNVPTAPVTKTDRHACNSRHTVNACANSMPVNGVVYNARRYNMSSFFSFQLQSLANINIVARQTQCQQNLLVRLFKQGLSPNCNTLDTAQIISIFEVNAALNCMEPGTYVLQVLSIDTVYNANNYNSSFGAFINSPNPICRFSELGQPFEITIQTTIARQNNNYGLSVPGRFDSINVVAGIMQPLQFGTTYNSIDTFGCLKTVMPLDTLCETDLNRAIYRQFNIQDSGILVIKNQNLGYMSPMSKLFMGDANALAVSQNTFSYPQTFTGLTPYTNCMTSIENCLSYATACLVPGSYSYVTYGNEYSSGIENDVDLMLKNVQSRFNSPATAEDLGDLMLRLSPGGSVSFLTEKDFYSCYDNLQTIDGVQPCGSTTKLIYRQFYLSAAANVSISAFVNCDEETRASGFTLFKGRASDGINSLRRYSEQLTCESSITLELCDALPVGWYTIVSYGKGPTYQNQNNSGLSLINSNVGWADQLRVNVEAACRGPQYNRPYKAAIDTITNQPFLIEWGLDPRTTNSFPKTDKLYSLYSESYNCTVDTPFLSQLLPVCNPDISKVTYYVFRTTQESYVSVITTYLDGSSRDMWSTVYAGDVRFDSTVFFNATPVQACLNGTGRIQICKLQPGVYTLILFAKNEDMCTSVIPQIYIDRVGVSKFDYAYNAYDFGVIPADGNFYNGKVGDVNPDDTARAPSNEFIYCTTGSSVGNPSRYGCSAYNPNISATAVNNSLFTPAHPGGLGIPPKRNVWYTFVIDKPGIVTVGINNRTLDKNNFFKFAVYKSDEDGSLTFSELKNLGKVDSTVSDRLTLVVENSSSGCSVSNNQAIFNVDVCTRVAERYYIIVENPGNFPSGMPGGVHPNSQLDVEIALEPAVVPPSPGDLCSDPIVAQMTGPGYVVASVTVDCHSMGSDYGELNLELTCPNGALTSRYKTSWFRLDITGTDTLDVTTYLSNNTNAVSSEIKYRLMNGNCNAMQERSCVQDALTMDTYNCLAPGSYFFQVFVPIRSSVFPFENVTGDVLLNVSSVQHAVQCVPANPCLAEANFVAVYNCNVWDDAVFINYSTFGSVVQYLWNFDYNGQTSTAFTPRFEYPVLPYSQTYNVALTVTNTECGGSDTGIVPVTVPARPYLELGNDTTLCTAGSVYTIDAGAFAGTTFLWSNGATTSSVDVATPGVHTYSVTAELNGCKKSDQVTVRINPIVSKNENITICDNDYVLLNSFRGFDETYSWSTGNSNSSLLVNNEGLFTNAVQWNGCIVIDSFQVDRSLPAEIWESEVAICDGEQYNLPWGVTVTNGGVYTNSIKYANGCDSLRQIVNVHQRPVEILESEVSMCEGGSFTLPWGQIVHHPDTYADTLHYQSGCDSVIHIVSVSNLEVERLQESFSICEDEVYTLPWGLHVSTEGFYSDTLKTGDGCDSFIHRIQLIVKSKPDLTITKSNDIGCNQTSSSLNVSGGISYQWYPETGLSNPGIANPVATPSILTVYYVDATGANGCTASDSIAVNVTREADDFYIVPSAFTPNNDGLNDCFGVPYWGNLYYFNMAIYNRWGELLFRSFDPAKCWDGRYKGKMQFAGTYVYVIYANGPCGRVRKKGTVVLIR